MGFIGNKVYFDFQTLVVAETRRVWFMLSTCWEEAIFLRWESTLHFKRMS